MTPRATDHDRLLHQLRAGLLAMVRDDHAPDLTLRQFAALMTCATGRERTVRGLTAHLEIPKPSVSRAIDKLEELKLVRRLRDPKDRRSVLIELTLSGRAMVGVLGISFESAGGDFDPDDGGGPGVRLAKAAEPSSG